MSLNTLRSGVTFGLIAGGLVLFLLVIGVPEYLPDLARPILLLLLLVTGAVLARGQEGKTSLGVVLVNTLIAGLIAAAMMLLFMGAINHFQAQGANIKQVFDSVTLRSTSVLAGVPVAELFPNPPPEQITEATVLRTDPMPGLAMLGAWLVAAALVGAVLYVGAARIRLVERVRAWRTGVITGREELVHWLTVALPLIAFGFILVTEWGVIALGASEQVLQLIASFLMVGAALFAVRAPQAGAGERLGYAMRAAILTAPVVLFIALTWAKLQTDTARALAVVVGVLAAVLFLQIARNPRVFERALTLTILVGVLIVSPLYLDQYQNQVLGLVGIHILLGLGLNVVVGYAGLLDLGYAAFFAIGAYAYAFLSAPRFTGNVEMRASLSASTVTALVVVPLVVIVGVALWRRRQPARAQGGGPSRYPRALSVAILAASVVITLLALRLLDGTAFMESFQDFPVFVIGLVVAMMAAGISGMLLGFPVLRLRGDYLAIVTLGFGEIVRLLLTNLRDFTGGPQGVLLIASPALLNVEFANPQAMLYLIVLGCMFVAFFSTRIKDSRLGRAWGAMRDDEDIAQATGVNIVQTKLLAFVVGATFAGIGGVLFAGRQHNIFPADFTLFVSIDVLSLIIIGGMGSIPGVIIGALVLIGLPEVLRGFEAYRIMLFGGLLVAMMLIKPEGLMPARARRLQRDVGPAAQEGVQP